MDTKIERKCFKKRTNFKLVGMSSNLFMKEKIKFKNNNM